MTRQRAITIAWPEYLVKETKQTVKINQDMSCNMHNDKYVTSHMSHPREPVRTIHGSNCPH